MRTFIALDLPEPFKGEAVALGRQLSELVGGRFVRPEGYHLTLAFMGELCDAEVSRALCAMERACAAGAPVTLTCWGLGTFGKARDATLWLDVTPTPELAALAEAVRGELAREGVPYEGRPFKAHVTLARHVRLQGSVALQGLPFPQAGVARCVTLYKSILDPAGAVYKPLHTVGLGADNSC